MAADASSSSTGRKEKDLEEMLQHLDLQDDELDDVVVGEEDLRKYEADARWLAIGRVNTTRIFSSSAMFETMKAVWGLAHEPKYREAGKNLYIFQMFCLGDWKRVVHGGPWLFRGMGMLIEDYNGKQDPASFDFDGLYVWAQIHNIPELYRKAEVVDQLARRIGRVKETQLSPRLLYEGDYVRVRARILVNKPLTRVTSLNVTGEGRKLLPVKYEKIPYFCQVCGFMGHNHEECGDGVWEAKHKQWGGWMLAKRREITPEQYDSGRGPRGGRSGGRGRGRAGMGAPPARTGSPRKRSSQDAGLDDDVEDGDDATSPLKPTTTREVDHRYEAPVARRNLQLALAGSPSDPEAAAAQGDESNNMLQNNQPIVVVPPPPPAYVSPREAKKAKNSASPGKQNKNKMASVAGSEPERRQAQ